MPPFTEQILPEQDLMDIHAYLRVDPGLAQSGQHPAAAGHRRLTATRVRVNLRESGAGLADVSQIII